MVTDPFHPLPMHMQREALFPVLAAVVAAIRAGRAAGVPLGLYPGEGQVDDLHLGQHSADPDFLPAECPSVFSAAWVAAGCDLPASGAKFAAGGACHAVALASVTGGGLRLPVDGRRCLGVMPAPALSAGPAATP
jgi:hypothetical protein